MNILYFIGNGFDINLGMKTRYSDFYEYYQSLDSKSDLIVKLKKHISDQIINWSDLELAFGKYTVNLNSIEEFDHTFEDIVENLGNYLIEQEKNYDFKKVDKDKFLNHLSFPESFFPEEDNSEIQNYKNKFGAVSWKVNIVTFNYTKAIETIIGNDIANLTIGNQNNSKPIIFKNIQHIHGYTDRRTIMGVNDVSQVGKIDFQTNQEIIEALIKPNCNSSQRHNIDKICKANVCDANLICIFGSSLGDTDNYWWHLIGEQLRRDIKLIIFSKGEEISQRFAYKSARSERAIKKIFLDKTDLTEDEKKEYSKNIYVGINTNMFSIS